MSYIFLSNKTSNQRCLTGFFWLFGLSDSKPILKLENNLFEKERDNLRLLGFPLSVVVCQCPYFCKL